MTSVHAAWHGRILDRKVDVERWLTDQPANAKVGRWVDPDIGRVALDKHVNAW